MSDTTVQINQDVFQSEVLEATIPVLVDFGATWCGPCKMLDPVVEKLAADWGEKVKVVKIDIDYNPDLAIQYQVMGVPTLILFVDGQPRERLTGYNPRNRIEAKFNPHLN